jgi:hypothetical protein
MIMITDVCVSFHQFLRALHDKVMVTGDFQKPTQPIGKSVCAPVPLASKIPQLAFQLYVRCKMHHAKNESSVSQWSKKSSSEVAFGPASSSAAVTLEDMFR